VYVGRSFVIFVVDVGAIVVVKLLARTMFYGTIGPMSSSTFARIASRRTLRQSNWKRIFVCARPHCALVVVRLSVPDA